MLLPSYFLPERQKRQGMLHRHRFVISIFIANGKGEVQPKIKNVYRSICEIYLTKKNLIRMLKNAFYGAFENNSSAAYIYQMAYYAFYLARN